MPIAVSGTRHALTLAHEQLIRAELVRYEPIEIHVGDCPTGVDAYVLSFWPVHERIVFAADWSLGHSAGPIRNGRMLRGCSALVAFPDAESRGTLNAIEQAIRAGIETHVFPLRFLR